MTDETIILLPLINKLNYIFKINPTIDIKIKDEVHNYPATNLCYLSKFFKVLIDNKFNNETAFDDLEVKSYLDYICFNIEFEIKQEKLLTFLTFCDFIQMNNIIYEQICNNISKIKIDIECIIPILFRNIDDDTKVKVFEKLNNNHHFTNISYRDMKLLLSRNCRIGRNNIYYYIDKSNISLEEKLDLLKLFCDISSINRRTVFKLYIDEYDNYYLNSITYYDEELSDFYKFDLKNKNIILVRHISLLRNLKEIREIKNNIFEQLVIILDSANKIEYYNRSILYTLSQNNLIKLID